jgi:hypothetical protein
MIVVNSIELNNDIERYLDLAKKDKIIIQRGNNEIFILTEERYLEPDEDLLRAITMDELLLGVKEDIREIYKTGK